MDPDKLKARREELEYTQKRMAELLSVPLATYQNWEQGRYSIPPLLAQHPLITTPKRIKK